MIQALTLIKSSLDLGSRVASFWSTVRGGQPSEIQEGVSQELADYESEMVYNRRCVDSLLQRSSETAAMVRPRLLFPFHPDLHPRSFRILTGS